MDDDIRHGRRRCLRSALAAPLLLSVAGCESLIRVLAGTCPDDPAESAGVDWTPDILHPMFWGFQDLDASIGAPGPLRIFYPTYEGTPRNAPVLKLCLVRYPVVLFLHGQPPCRDDAYFQRWQALPMVLARSGYVVVVPKHAASVPADPESSAVTFALAVLDWVRSGWAHRRWVDADVDATAIAGHSFGALLAARVRVQRPSIGAYVGLSGVWTDVPDGPDLVRAVRPPSFFMWATRSDGAATESLDEGGLWSAIAPGKTAAVFPGKHFDYLGAVPGCEFSRGDCTRIELAAADLVALFIARQVPVKLSHAPIPPNLVPPSPVTLTPKQAFFAGGHLNGIPALEAERGCSIDLRWENPGNDSGTRHIGA